MIQTNHVKNIKTYTEAQNEALTRLLNNNEVEIERPSQDLVDLLIKHDYVYLAANNEDGMETAWVHKSVQNDINHSAIQETGWKSGDTKWIKMKNGKLEVNDPKAKKKKGKKQ